MSTGNALVSEFKGLFDRFRVHRSTHETLLEEMMSKLTDLANKVDGYVAIIADLRTKSTTSDSKAADLQKQLDAANATIADLQKQITDNDAAAGAVEDKLDAATAETPAEGSQPEAPAA